MAAKPAGFALRPHGKPAGGASDNKGKVFDVLRPGHAPAPATSRPVIVGHKPQVDDPLVRHQPVAEPGRAAHRQPLADDPNELRELLNPAQKVSIKPSHAAARQTPTPPDQTAPEPPATAPGPPQAAATAEANGSSPAAAATPLPVPKSTSPELAAVAASLDEAQDGDDAAPPPASEHQQQVDAATSALQTSTAITEAAHAQAASSIQTSPPPAAPAAPGNAFGVATTEPDPNAAFANAANASPNALVSAPPPVSAEILATTTAPLVDMSQAVVSSHMQHHRRWRRALGVVLVLLVLAAVALDVLLDAGVLKTTRHIPHTHFWPHS